ncbi:calponin homology domain-containing protein [Pisolithus orientalis]|uniref:calponin homology domain-containing protein n=1 Tax=Pisolithus orientalis TaxID=936130 RepID=UPI0022255CC7|nr:calponin homology domain-containing protein [Pisolithus orientalis]KAI6030771.1 calponin homology domain-containing protein [Pisolithus orientalis]
MTAISRSDLLAWLNELLQLNYTKIEQCGTGGAYCQILDSIYGDVPMTKVKMNAKGEYEFVANFKVMQNVFKARKINKASRSLQPIPIEKLVKCKMQDNLEFLRWIRHFWDSNYGGQGYDPVARRRGVPTGTPSTIAPLSSSRTGGASAGLGIGGRVGGKRPISSNRAGSAQPNEIMQNLQAEIRDLTTRMEGLEKETDFYFAKLRDIEILVRQEMETLTDVQEPQKLALENIQKVLYSTEVCEIRFGSNDLLTVRFRMALGMNAK